jgi:hypothetical protein
VLLAASNSPRLLAATSERAPPSPLPPLDGAGPAAYAAAAYAAAARAALCGLSRPLLRARRPLLTGPALDAGAMEDEV